MSLLKIALFISDTLLFATPLLFTALGGMFTEKAGVTNIGLEGMMTIGAFAGPIGWVITGLWTLADVAGPAYRVTIPAVIQVAFLRQYLINKQNNSENN